MTSIHSLLLFAIPLALIAAPATAQVLFEDPLSGPNANAWKVAPTDFGKAPDGSPAYRLDFDRLAEHPPAFVGDQSWKSYRVEIEFYCLGGGWVGFDFHVQDDAARAAQLEFWSGSNLLTPPFEHAASWRKGHLTWKYWPYSEHLLNRPAEGWVRVRLDVGENVANAYFGDGDQPLYTVYDVPFATGGVRLWTYHGAAFVRHLKVTALPEGSVKPLLPDVWAAGRGSDVLRNWKLSSPTNPAAVAERSPEIDVDPVVDPRGIVMVSATFPDWKPSGEVWASTSIPASVAGARKLFFSYTDRVTLWLNGTQVFEGAPRGWRDPGREPDDWFGRLKPDQFSIDLPLKAGENELVVRSVTTEPEFGWGFWARLAH